MSLSFFGIIVVVMLIAVVIGTIVDVVRQPFSTLATVAWIALVLVLPFVGSIIYWISRKPQEGDAEEMYRVQAEQRRAAERRPFDSTGMGP